MRKASHDRFGAWLRRLCTSERESRFEYYWKYVCDGVKTGLNQPLNRGEGLVKSCFVFPILHTKSKSSLIFKKIF